MYPDTTAESTGAESIIWIHRPAQLIEQRRKGASPVTHRRLLFTRRITEALVALLGIEIRVVAKTIHAVRHLENAAVHLTPTHELARRICVGRRADVVRAAIRLLPQRLLQQTIVLVIQRLAGEIETAAPAFAHHTGTP